MQKQLLLPPKPKTNVGILKPQNQLPVTATRSQTQQRQISQKSIPSKYNNILNIINDKGSQMSQKEALPQNKLTKIKPQQVQQEEQKQQQPKQGLFTEKPSAKLTGIKTIDPFSDKSKQKTNSFAYVYNAGGIPCRVNHGCSVMRLQWNAGVSVETLAYDPLLVTCFDGLIEEGHPYSFIAFNAIKEMLEFNGSSEKVIPIVLKLVWPLRQALSSKSDKVFESALAALKMLSDCVGSHINGQVKNLVVPLTRKMERKEYRDRIFDVLRSLEENGGPDAYKAIKGAIPTYSNV